MDTRVLIIGVVAEKVRGGKGLFTRTTFKSPFVRQQCLRCHLPPVSHAMALPFQPGLTPSEIAFLCEMESVTVIPRQRMESLELLGVSGA